MILPVRIEVITDTQKEPREIYAYYEDGVRRIYFAHNQWLDCETACPVDEEPKFYLPDGLPDPSQAVEVFEGTVFREVGAKLVQMPREFNEYDKVMIYKKVQNA